MWQERDSDGSDWGAGPTHLILYQNEHEEVYARIRRKAGKAVVINRLLSIHVCDIAPIVELGGPYTFSGLHFFTRHFLVVHPFVEVMHARQEACQCPETIAAKAIKHARAGL